MSKSVIPPTGEFGLNWPGHFNIPQGASGLISAAGWTYKNEGFIQQTFLGASIRSFNIVAGFGDTASTLSVQLVEDEYNTSDGTGLGLGDDVYHNGNRDNFIPPAVGSPVFFKFGKTFATVEQAWRKLFDDIYNTNTLDNNDEPVFSEESKLPIPLEENQYLDLSQSDISDDKYVFAQQNYLDSTGYNGDRFDPPNETSRGSNHIVFAGILQSYVENKGPDGNPLYSVQVVDPREILSNAVVILNNYAGSVFGNKNYLNVYGFLEYDPSDQLLVQLNSLSQPGFNIGPIESAATWVTTIPFSTDTKFSNNLEKIVNRNTGQVFYFGNDMYKLTPFPFSIGVLPEFFPMTGQGFSRRSEQGIPWYRVRQGLEALFNYKGFLPQEYIDKGFGGPINFRGYNYVVDFSGIPIEKIPQMYFLNYDQMDLLSLCQELCDVISHDLSITLLPVINHPASQFLFQYNNYYSQVDPSKIIAGIIRVTAIDRSVSPKIGEIKEYLDSLESRGIHVESQDLGYELSNVTTDKIVAGAQEVEMYYFNTNKDRDNLQFRKLLNAESNSYAYLQGAQWLLETSLNQQVLPFYGFLGKDVPTIPLGFGSYQQILLDASSLDAYGVGNYYVATEMELRAALSSYEDWAHFLSQYNETYIEEVGENQVLYQKIAQTNQTTGIEKDYGVSVPRCVFISEKNYVDKNGYPASPCSPPYGYPLYYKRAERIGIPEAGILQYANNFFEVITKYNTLADQAAKRDEILYTRNSLRTNISDLLNSINSQDLENNEELKKQLDIMQYELDVLNAELDDAERSDVASIKLRSVLDNNKHFIKSLNSLASIHSRNAKKVYEFVRGIAEKHLGRTFLVKIPKQCNVNYNNEISIFGKLQVNNIWTGPYGFRPIPINSNINQINFDATLSNYRNLLSPDVLFEHYLDNTNPYKYTYGALKCNFNPISDNWEFNYKPEPQGGFFNYSLFDRNLSFSQLLELSATTRVPFVQAQLLAPMDLTNFTESSRIQAYVRFDNSQFLDFSNIGKENLAQQIITAEGFIPDMLEELNNINPDVKESFRDVERRLEFETKPQSVCFVKCDIDEKLYLLPKFVRRFTPVFARNTTKHSVRQNPIVNTTTDPNGCTKVEQINLPDIDIFLIDNNGGVDGTEVELLDFNRYYSLDFDANIINTEKEALNSDFVYAIITLPGKVVPTVDQRYLDGAYQAMNATSIKHVMCIDVVKGAPGFDKPDFKTNTQPTIVCNNFTFEQLTGAQKAQRDINQSIGFANPNIRLGYTHPSPVYPDLVALPLMSMERCYGPWISSAIPNGTDGRIRYSDIGGKVEFVKDENLAPWNYAGYQLMNEAGFLQAQFSNSLLLFSERGGFVVPDIPYGVNLAQPLNNNGPLVTSISVNIDSSVKTTVRMDLYTSRFGKLQKQKEEAIGMIVRERQKIIDQNNSMIRNGLLKRITGNTNILAPLTIANSEINEFAEKPIKDIVIDINSYVNENGDTVWYTDTALRKDGDIEKAMAFYDNITALGVKLQNTATKSLSSLFTPASEVPSDPRAPSSEYIHQNTVDRIIKDFS